MCYVLVVDDLESGVHSGGFCERFHDGSELFLLVMRT